MNTAYFLAKEELPFSKFEGLLVKRMASKLISRIQMLSGAQKWCQRLEKCLKISIPKRQQKQITSARWPTELLMSAELKKRPYTFIFSVMEGQ